MWVLIVIAYVAGQGGPSIAMHDFNDQAACTKAQGLA